VQTKIFLLPGYSQITAEVESRTRSNWGFVCTGRRLRVFYYSHSLIKKSDQNLLWVFV